MKNLQHALSLLDRMNLLQPAHLLLIKVFLNQLLLILVWIFDFLEEFNGIMGVFAEFPIFFGVATKAKLLLALAKRPVSALVWETKKDVLLKLMRRAICLVAFIAMTHLGTLLSQVGRLLFLSISIRFLWQFGPEHKLLVSFLLVLLWWFGQTFVFRPALAFQIFFANIVSCDWVDLLGRCFVLVFKHKIAAAL